MKLKTALLALFTLSLFITCTWAQWPLNSGYAVTTNYHGEDVPPGTLVLATAGTTDPNVENVTFSWKYPDKTTAFTDPEVVVWSNDTYWTNSSGTYLIYYAQSSHTPDDIGDWGVQALFNGPGGHIRGPESDIIKIRATSINTIPEIPVVGAAGAVAIMLLSLGLFLKKKR